MVGPVSDGDDHAEEYHGGVGGEVEVEEDAEEEDEIECIVGHRYILPSTSSSSGTGDSQQPRLLYCVHWKGSSPDGSEDEYFDRDDLLRDYPAVVRRYEEERRRRAMQQQ